MDSGNLSSDQVEFMKNMGLFKHGRVNQSYHEVLYLSLLDYLTKDKSDPTSMRLIELIKLDYMRFQNMRGFIPHTTLWITLWFIICLIGVIGNIFVITVFCGNKQHVVYEVFCIGLAVTDLSFLLLMVPITILNYVFKSWIFGHFLCRTVNFVAYGSLFSSAIMLVSLTVSRYMAVVRPWDHRNMTSKEATVACFIAWLAGYLCSTPIAIYFKVVNGGCKHHFPSLISGQIYFSAVLAFTYLIPFAGIISMNCLIVIALKKETNKKNASTNVTQLITNIEPTSSRQKRQQQRTSKVTRLVIVVASTYGLCWLPTQLLNSWYYLSPATFPHTRSMQYVKGISQTLSYASACLNPFIYSIISQSFQASVKKQFPRLHQIIASINHCKKYNQNGIEHQRTESNKHWNKLSLSVTAGKTIENTLVVEKM